MRFRCAIASMCAGLLAAALFVQVAHAHGATVEISAEGVAPAELTIERGETVHFENVDDRAHVVVGEDDAFHSPELAAAGGGWHLRFPYPGRFPFALEDRPEVRGVIVVEDAAD